jgi:hypothetical protein
VLTVPQTAGPSMHPTFNAAGDSVWVYRRIDPTTDLRVGDIVHGAPTPYLCKSLMTQPPLKERKANRIRVVARSHDCGWLTVQHGRLRIAGWRASSREC